MDRYSSGSLSKAFEYLNQGRYQEALLAARHQLTWYILCHKAHTVPFLTSKMQLAYDLLKIDIEALAEILEEVHRCYYNTGMSDQFPGVLDRLSGIVADRRWSDKITYLRALWYLVDKKNRETALSVISTLNIDECKDPEVLTLYLDVYLPALSLQKSLDIMDRILENTVKESYKLQYTTLKGLRYCLVSEIKEGCKIIIEGIGRFRALDEAEKTSYGKLQFSHALLIAGQFTENKALVEEAVKVYDDLLDTAEKKSYPQGYIAELLRSQGDCFESLELYGRAIASYKKSISLDTQEITKVFLARSLLHNEKADDCRQMLSAIVRTELDDAGLCDYAFSWTRLAAVTCYQQDIDTAIELLKAMKTEYPLFNQQRDRSLITLLETEPKSRVGVFRELLRRINRYVSLNPNIFGIGININKIIEDADSAIKQPKQ